MPSASFVGSKVASVARPASSSAVSMAASDMVGSSAPLGFFDPMGFSKGPAERLNAYRESELKHGRTAMLAVVGFLTQVSQVCQAGFQQGCSKCLWVVFGGGFAGFIQAWLRVCFDAECVSCAPCVRDRSNPLEKMFQSFRFFLMLTRVVDIVVQLLEQRAAHP